MTLPSATEYENVIVDGVVSIEPASEKEFDRGPFAVVLVLIGPTGAGKSSFIEALASQALRKPLGIAKDQLESVTKTVQIYLLRNVKRVGQGDPVYLVDTPGFADPSISELQVLRSVQRWRNACNNRDAVRVLYFHPITDIRMPSSKRKCMEIMKSFWGVYNAETFTLVTTMWNQIKPEAKERAKVRLNSVSSDVWGDWSEKGSGPTQFFNTFESAMQILDKVIDSKNRPVDTPTADGYGDPSPQTGTLVVEEVLRERIQGLYQQLQRIGEDLDDPSNQTNEELKQILRKDQESALVLLQKFTVELEHLRQPNIVPPHWHNATSSSQAFLKKTKQWFKTHWSRARAEHR